MLYPSKYVLITDIDANMKTDKCPNESKKCKEFHKKLTADDKPEIEYFESCFSDGIQKSVGGVLPERVWQDVVMNPAYTTPSSLASEKSEQTNDENPIEKYDNNENSINAANYGENSSKVVEHNGIGGLWNFVEPFLKNTCSCKR